MIRPLLAASYRATRRLAAVPMALPGTAAFAALPGGVVPALAQPASDTVATIRARVMLVCGVAGQVPGFSAPDSRAEMRGLGRNNYRTVAAIFGDASKVRFVTTPALSGPSPPAARFCNLLAASLPGAAIALFQPPERPPPCAD